VGDKKAAEEFDVSPSTVRSWRFRAKRDPATAGLEMPDKETVSKASVKRVGDAQRQAKLLGDELTPDELRKSAKSAHRAMDKAIKRLDEVLAISKSPRDISIAAGIMSDKAHQMYAIVQAFEERDHRLAEEDGRTIVGLLEVAFEALGVPLTPEVRALWRELLSRVAAGPPYAVSPDVCEPARKSIVEFFARTFGIELGRPELPPGDYEAADPVDVEEADESEELVEDVEIVEPEPEPVRRNEREEESGRWGLGGGFGAQVYEVFRSPGF
jgi:transposase-like protein